MVKETVGCGAIPTALIRILRVDMDLQAYTVGIEFDFT